MFKIIKILLINILIFLFIYLLIEVFSGRLLFNKNQLNCSYILCDKKIIYDGVLFHNSATTYNIVYQKDKFGFRGRKKTLDKIDILTVGGSTTDERYLKLEDTWSEKLEKKFKSTYQNFDVVNAGIDGQSTNGHLWNFENWFNKLENFKPKYIIFYIGINEVLSQQVNVYKHGNNYDNNTNISKLTFFRKIQYFLKKNNGITYKSYNLIYKKWFLKDKAQVGHDALRKKLKYIIPSEKRKINYSTKEMFINNLKKLTEYSKSQNSIPIFVTQRTRRWHKENNIVYSVSKVDFYKYEKEVSETILFFCEKNKLFCVDLNGILDLEENDTYDRIHLTTTGAEKVAEKIFNNIKNYIYTNMIN